MKKLLSFIFISCIALGAYAQDEEKLISSGTNP